jgi:cytochrome P450
MDLLGAGHDTTANLITFTLAAIFENEERDWVSKLKSEVQRFSDTFGERSDYNQEESFLVLDFVEHKMPILDATVTESMRLFPLGAAFSRVSTTDVQMSGYKIPGGKNNINYHHTQKEQSY